MTRLPLAALAALCALLAPAAAQTPSVPSARPGENPEAWGVGAPAGARNVIVGTLINRSLYDAQGQPLGEIKGVALNLDQDRFYLVVAPRQAAGGAEVVVPLRDSAIRDERLVAANLSAAQLAQAPAFTRGRPQWRLLVEDTVVPVSD